MDSTPTSSVTGKEGWQWNRLQEDRRAAAQSQRARSTDPRQRSPAERPTRATTPDETWADRQTLVATLERKDRRLQTVITRYERLLDERDRELAEATTESTWSGRTSALIQTFRRLIASW